MAAPQSNYRVWMGVYKDTVNGNLSANYPSGSTSIALQNVVGAPTSSMTMTIVDGPLTEQVTVSAYSSGTVTCAATANAHSANAYVYFQLTTGIGPTALLRMTKIGVSDNYDNKLYDTGYEGSQAMVFGAQQGMRVGALSFEGQLVPDEFGWILGSFFGAYDYTATSGSNPTTYAFSPANSAASNGQPTPYVFYWYNPGDNTLRVAAKSVISDLTIKFDPTALTTWTATGMSFATGVITNPSPATALAVGFSSFKPLPSRQASVTIASSYTGLVETAEYQLKREEFAAINTLQGIQDPLALFGGPISCTVSTSIVMTNSTLLNDYINQTQPAIVLTALQGNSGGANPGVPSATTTNGLVLQNSVANFEDVHVVNDGAYVKLEGSWSGIANATDASTAGGGKSPIKATLSVGTNTGSSSTPY
jgi:hypothetical protein